MPNLCKQCLRSIYLPIPLKIVLIVLIIGGCICAAFFLKLFEPLLYYQISLAIVALLLSIAIWVLIPKISVNQRKKNEAESSRIIPVNHRQQQRTANVIQMATFFFLFCYFSFFCENRKNKHPTCEYTVLSQVIPQ